MHRKIAGIAEIHPLSIVVVAYHLVTAYGKGYAPSVKVAEIEAPWLAAFKRVEENAHTVRVGRWCIPPVELQAERCHMRMLHTEFLMGAGEQTQHSAEQQDQMESFHLFCPPFLFCRKSNTLTREISSLVRPRYCCFLVASQT